MELIIDPLYIVIAVAVAALFIYVMANGFLQWSKSAKIPLVTVKVTVLDKRAVPTAGDSAGVRELGKQAFMEYYASFVNSNDAEKELRITKSEYEALTLGVTGMLTYRGDIMLSFEAAECCSDENEVETDEK